jgi:MFS family permease
MRTHQISSRSPSSVWWLGVGALSALYAVFTLSWVIYRIHLPGLLMHFGFSADFASKLLLIETILAIVLEPLLGETSDQMEQQRGTRLPLILLGIVLASVAFVAIPTWATFVPSVGIWRWGLPGLLLVWAIVMSIFRSPAIALLRQYASTKRLPLATSGLTFAAGMAGAATPLAKQLILDVGGTITFIAAAILLLATASALRSVAPTTAPELPHSEPIEPYSLSRLCLIFVTGLAVTLAFRLAIETLPKILKTQLPQVNAAMFVGTIFVTLALAAFPAGVLATRFGNRKAILLGLVGSAGFLGLMAVIHSPFVGMSIAVGLGSCFSFVINGTLPFVLSLVTPHQAGLAVGAFFGGAAAATSLLGGLSLSGGLSPIAGICLGAIALLAAGLYITTSVEPEPI